MEFADMAEILERCSEPGSAYHAFRERGEAGYILKSWMEPGDGFVEFLGGLENPSHLFKSSKKIRAAIVADLFVKRYNFRSWRNAFRRTFRTPRPYRVLAASLRLKEYAIPTAEVLAAVRFSRYRLAYEDFLITRKLSPLQLFCSDLAGEFAAGDPYRQFVSGVVSMLVKMHTAGVEHGDLSLRNLFCRKSQIGNYSDWGVIDLDGASVYDEELGLSRRRRELARLVSSYLRCIRDRDKSLKPDVPSIIFDFARKYQEISGCNLAGNELDERVKYLAERVRKN